MLVFDRFPDQPTADIFAEDIANNYDVSAQVFDNEADAKAIYPVPFSLTAPIVLVDLPEGDERADLIADQADRHGGIVGGT